MERFPVMKEGQVALLRAETVTGHVLDELFQPVISDTQKVYTVFDSYPDAVASAEEIIKIKGLEIECYIYDHDQMLLKYINPYTPDQEIL